MSPIINVQLRCTNKLCSWTNSGAGVRNQLTGESPTYENYVWNIFGLSVAVLLVTEGKFCADAEVHVETCRESKM